MNIREMTKMTDEYDLKQEKLDEMREDMLIEIKLRNDDDYFYDHMMDKFGETLSDLYVQIENEVSMYDRGDQLDEWFQILLEK